MPKGVLSPEEKAAREVTKSLRAPARIGKAETKAWRVKVAAIREAGL
jgi:hypothetical protein